MSLLQYFHPAQEPATERVALIYGCDPTTQSRYKGQHRPTLEVRIMRMDEEGKGFRWANWANAKSPGYLVDDLILRVSIEQASRNHYCGFEYAFEPSLNRVDADTAERMHRTLKRLRTRAETHPQAGNHVEVLIWVRDMLKSLGIETLVGYKHDTLRGDLGNPDNFVALPHMRAMMNHVKTVTEKMCGEPLQDVA